MKSVWVTSLCRHVTSLSSSQLLWCHVWCNMKNFSTVQHYSPLSLPSLSPLSPSVSELADLLSRLCCTCNALQDVKLQHLTWFIVVLWLRLQHHHYQVVVSFSSPTLPAHLYFVRLMLIFDLRGFLCLSHCCPLAFMMQGHEREEMFHHNEIDVFCVTYHKWKTEAELVKLSEITWTEINSSSEINKDISKTSGSNYWQVV